MPGGQKSVLPGVKKMPRLEGRNAWRAEECPGRSEENAPPGGQKCLEGRRVSCQQNAPPEGRNAWRQKCLQECLKGRRTPCREGRRMPRLEGRRTPRLVCHECRKMLRHDPPRVRKNARLECQECRKMLRQKCQGYGRMPHLEGRRTPCLVCQECRKMLRQKCLEGRRGSCQE
nr:uncharacterized protein LOC113813868 [Penaeus vannamei]